MFKSRLMGLMIVLVLLVGIVPLQAQEPVTISIGLPPIYEELLKPGIDEFMSANPDIVVEIVTADAPGYTPGDDIEAYLDEVAEYAQAADVLTGQNVFNAITTRAGYFLELSPLVNADASLNIDEFFPSMWQSYQWDGGIWAIPLAGDVVGLAYEPAAFDEAGLAYPNERWTLDDLVIAAEALAVYAEGDVVAEPPVTNFADAGYVAVAALDNPLYDTFQFEGTPSFDNPQLEPAIEIWADLQERGLVALPEGLEFTPIVFAPSVITALVAFSGSEAEYAFTTLPGGSVAVQPIGAGISAGSTQPEAAYRLIKYMTQSENIFTAIVGQPIPARRTLVGAESSNPLLALSLPEELVEQVLEYVETAVPYSQTLFSDYVSQAATNVISSDTTVADALSTMASQAIDDLTAAANRSGTTVTVNQNDNAIVGTGDVTLTFGMVGFGPIANREGWDAAIAEFVQNNPQVATVELQRLSFLSGDVTLTDFHEKVDCFYQPSRLDTNEDLTLLLPIDPLLSADPNLSLDDFVGNTVQLLSQNGVTYGIPLHVQPEVLYYNADLFNAAGAFMPYQGWTVNDFEQALRTLRFDANDPAPFEPGAGGTYALALIAAYGGLPMDYRTSPPTVDFLSETNVNAIRQVLDLAKEGYIDYAPLAPAGGAAFGGDEEGQENPAMYTAAMSDLLAFATGGEEDDSASDYRLVTLPQGVEYSAVSYDIGSAYITAQTEHPDECYAFISHISGEATLFDSMPARRSVINSPELEQAQGEAAVEFFNGLDAQLQQPNVIEFPLQTALNFAQIGDLLSALWLYRAMDRYVLEDADLVSELTDAQQFTLDYQACVAQIPPFNETENANIQTFATQFAQCAVNVDETTRDIFAGLGL